MKDARQADAVPDSVTYKGYLDRIGVPEELREQYVEDMWSIVASVQDQVKRELEEPRQEELAAPPLGETIEQKRRRLMCELGIE